MFGARSLSTALSKNSTLTSLDLWGNEIGDTGVRFLLEAPLDVTALRNLAFRDNMIGDAGVASVTKALSGNISLTNLDLRDNMISDSGVVFLTKALLINTTLNLNLRGNVIHYTRVPSNVRSRLSVRLKAISLENDGCTYGDDGDGIFEDNCDSGSNSYSSGDESDSGEKISSTSSFSSDSELPNSEDEQFIDDTHDEGVLANDSRNDQSPSDDSSSRSHTSSSDDSSYSGY